MEQTTTLSAVEFRINSVVGPNGQGIALTVQGVLPGWQDGAAMAVGIFFPSVDPAELAQGILSQSVRLKVTTQ